MKDRFSGHADRYSSFRPLYPAELYDFLFSQVSAFDAAWDAGTGNGQAARELARRFTKVYATDISARQLENAVKAGNIFYSQAGETADIPSASLDLVTVAQAIHWFDREKFYEEVRRVGKKMCVVAVWGYGLLSVNKSIDPLILDYYVNVVGPYWDAERKHVEQAFQTIAFPFKEIQPPEFTFSFQFTLDRLAGYISTWSATVKYVQANHTDPVPKLIERIRPLWTSDKLQVTYPLFMRIGRL